MSQLWFQLQSNQIILLQFIILPIIQSNTMILNKLNQRFLKIQQIAFKGIKYSKQGIFKSHPQTVFKVVKNTQDYSQFIPWCSKSTIVKKISNVQNFTQLTIVFQKVKQLSYLSHVQILGENDQHSKYKIQSICNEKPLKSLVSIWEIDKNPIIEGQLEQSLVKYSIQYEFSSPFLQITSHLFLDYVGQSMWVIFKQQAENKHLQIQESKSRDSKQAQNQLSFGKFTQNTHQSVKIHEEDQERLHQDQGNKKSQNAFETTNLAEYLSKYPVIHQIYCRNQDFKNKLDHWGKLLDGTKNFQQKIEFKIKNYLIHKS